MGRTLIIIGLAIVAIGLLAARLARGVAASLRRRWRVELQPGEPGIEAAPLHERVVRAFLDDASAIEHEDAVA